MSGVLLGADGRPASGRPAVSSIAEDLALLADLERRSWPRHARRLIDSGDPTAADGIFYHDTREPFLTVAPAAVTLATTAKALYTASQFPVLGGQYWVRPGKKLRIRLFGQMTTVLTPGNGSFNVYYGTGADANGVLLMTGTPVALSASQTNLSWNCEITVTCRTTGSVGTLFCDGKAHFNVALIASTLQPILLPASVPAVSGACDLTAANIISVQYLRSGSTVETMQVVDMEVVSLN